MDFQYGKWPESVKKADSCGWAPEDRLIAGIDVGTTSTQAVVMAGEAVLGWASIATGSDFENAGARALELALADSGLVPDMLELGATGWGAGHVAGAESFNEIDCHARGGRFLYGEDVHTVVDLGGQTVKAIRLYDWDRVRDVMIGDKCASGMGRSIELFCDAMQIPICEIGSRSLDVSAEPEPVSTTCQVFARSEALGLFGRPEFRSEPLSENQVYASFLYAVAWRAVGVIGKLQPLDVGDVRVYEKLGLTGGVANNPGVTQRIARELKLELPESRYDPILAGAIGAALMVRSEQRRV